MNESQMTLCTDWEGQDPSGWLVSEKLDGCRAYWDGTNLWTRKGNIIFAPEWFTAGLPENVHLDGELWAGRGRFTEARLACQYGARYFDNRHVFRVFDCPTVSGTWLERIRGAQRATRAAEFASTVEFWRSSGLDELVERFFLLTGVGAEGLVFRNPNAIGYEHGRSQNVLRIKPGNPFVHCWPRRLPTTHNTENVFRIKPGNPVM